MAALVVGMATHATLQPVVHVHVSGSAGTWMCKAGRLQTPAPGMHRGGNAYNCLLPCAGPSHWKEFSLSGGLELPLTKYDSPAKCAALNPVHLGRTSCSALQDKMFRSGYGVVGMIETVLGELADPEYASRLVAFRAHRLRWCNHSRPVCPSSNATSLIRPGVYERLDVPPGGEYFMEQLWPMGEWRPGSTYCPNLRFTFLMHSPVHRLLSQLIKQCPRNPANRWADLSAGRHGSKTRLASLGCAAWATRILKHVYAHDVVLDDGDKQGWPGTPAASNYNIRLLLGPRVFYARLGSLNRTHLQAAKDLLSRFAFVGPVSRLGNASAVLARQLGWISPASSDKVNARAKDRHRRPSAHGFVWEGAVHVERAAVAAVGADVLNAHNALDLELYAWVEERFARDLTAAQQAS